MDRPLRIKPHHFVDILSDLGRGKRHFEPHPYGHAVHSVAEILLADRHHLLELVVEADDICEPCDHNTVSGCDDVIDTSFRPQAPRAKQQWNMTLDRRWLTRLGMSAGDCVNADCLCMMLADHAERLERIYEEEPPDRCCSRAANLRKGIEFFLNS